MSAIESDDSRRSDRADELDEAGELDVAALLAQYDQWLSGDTWALIEGAILAPSTDQDDSLARDQAFLARMALAWPRNRSTEGSAPPTAGAPQHAGAPLDAADQPPGRLGRFTIERILGRGGAGIVFLAHDPLLRRSVALKVPRPELLVTAAARRRFLREGHAAAGLSHPNILTLFEAGEIGPMCYLVSAYCRGPTLAAWLAAQSKPVDLRQAAGWIARLADAVHYAHTRGVLHRDIKPSNVLLEPLTDAAEPGYEVLLADFGLAKLPRTDACETHTGTVLGTPAYMAPEQARGKLDEVGPAADVYSLGVVLYELLTGRPPFQGSTDLEVLQQVVSGQPRPPSQLRRDVPRDLCAIVLCALEAVPRRRYASAADLALDLRRFLAGEPTAARPLRPTQRLARWCRHRPALAATLALLLVTNIAGFVAVTWQWRRAEVHLAIAQEERAKAEEGWRDQTRLVSEVFRQGAETSGKLIPVRPTVRARLLAYYETVLAAAGSTKFSPEQIATAFVKRALLLPKTADHKRIAALDEGLGRWRALVAQRPDDPVLGAGLADAETDAVYIYLALSQWDPAEQHAAAGAAVLLQPVFAHPRYVEYRLRLGGALRLIATDSYEKEQYQAAIQACRQALAYWEECGSPPEKYATEAQNAQLACLKTAARAHRKLAERDKLADDWEGAAGHLQEVKRLYDAVLNIGPNDEMLYQLARDFRDLGSHCNRLPNHAAACEAYQEAERLLINIDPQTNPQAQQDLANVRMKLGSVCDDLSKPARAWAYYRQAAQDYASLSQQNPGQHEYLAQSGVAQFWGARLQAELGQPGAAVAFEQACASLAAASNDADATTDDWGYLARCHYHFAGWLTRQRRVTEAQPHFAAAAAAYRKVLLEKPGETGFAKDLAQCQRMLAVAGADLELRAVDP